jgi:hypothetical protein
MHTSRSDSPSLPSCRELLPLPSRLRLTGVRHGRSVHVIALGSDRPVIIWCEHLQCLLSHSARCRPFFNHSSLEGCFCLLRMSHHRTELALQALYRPNVDWAYGQSNASSIQRAAFASLLFKLAPDTLNRPSRSNAVPTSPSRSSTSFHRLAPPASDALIALSRPNAVPMSPPLDLLTGSGQS